MDGLGLDMGLRGGGGLMGWREDGCRVERGAGHGAEMKGPGGDGYPAALGWRPLGPLFPIPRFACLSQGWKL